MTKRQATEVILKAKKEKGLTWDQIAAEVGGQTIWVTSALLGQNCMAEEEAKKAAALLGLSDEVAAALQDHPFKGRLHDTLRVDPSILRLHEIAPEYRTSMTEIIHDIFGDGEAARGNVSSPPGPYEE